MLIEGLFTIIILAIFIVLYITQVKSGIKDAERILKRGRYPTAKEVRNHLAKLYKIMTSIVLGKQIHDVEISFGSLDYETPKDLSIRKNSEFQRMMICYSHGLINAKSVKEMINKQDILPISIEVNDEVFKTQPLELQIEQGKPDEETEIGIKDLKTRTFTSESEKKEDKNV